MHILIATDAQWVADAVVAALGDSQTSFTVVREGREVTRVVEARTPDIAVLDLQIGSMGGMAVTMNLRHDESSGALPHIPVLMLLDREVDTFLARRSGAEGWLVKPLDPFAIVRAVDAILHPPAPAVLAETVDAETADAAAETAEEETVGAG